MTIPKNLYLCTNNEISGDAVIVSTMAEAEAIGYRFIDVFLDDGKHAQTFERVIDDNNEYVVPPTYVSC